jgi:rhodanese-related sulfurtransferase
MDFIFLDVSSEQFQSKANIQGIMKIPFSQLERRYAEIPSKTIPIMVISEDGLYSILACEILVRKGYFNVNNISGGHQFWPGASVENQLEEFGRSA